MVAELIIAPESEQDILDAYGWYERQRIGLGEEFLTCLDASLEATCRNPKMHTIVHEKYRRGLVGY